MAQYAGLCIGGPMAGQLITRAEKRMLVEDPGPRAPLREKLEASITNEVRQHVYMWTHIGPFALWLDESTDLNQALNDMAIAYSEKHHGNAAR